MTPEEKEDIESLAIDGCCPAAVRYVSSTMVTQFGCDQPPHRGDLHWNDKAGCCWVGPPEPVERSG